MMNKYVKMAGIAAAGTVAAGLTACGADKAAETPAPQPKGKAIVVYYSASGYTKRAAQIIADETGADIYEVKLAQPYTEADLNYMDSDSRVSREHDNPDLRHLALAEKTPVNWADYSTVFVGYPIWWGIAAWPLSSFVEQNNFEGKTVIPFATAHSSGFGESGALLEKAAGKGNWKQGTRFFMDAKEAEIRNWAKKVF